MKMGSNQPQPFVIDIEKPMGSCIESVQITKQEESQSYSNSSMCHTLSAAENLAYRVCIENCNGNQKDINQFFEGYKTILKQQYQNKRLIFDAYDSFDGGKKKSIKDLLVQLIFQIENFKGDFSYYISHYKKYDYPMNLNEKQVIRLILYWLHIVEDIEILNPKFQQYEFSKYYRNLIYVLQNRQSNNYLQDIYNLEADNPNRGLVNLNVFQQGYAKAMKNQNDYVYNNAGTKKVDLYGQNSLKMDVDSMHSNENAFEKAIPKGASGGGHHTSTRTKGGNNANNNNNMVYDEFK